MIEMEVALVIGAAMGTNLLCNTCGNELHIDAEACWRCGSHTESGLVRKAERARARQVEEEKRVELRHEEDSAAQALTPNRVFRRPASSAWAPSEVLLLNGEQAMQVELG